MSRAGAVELRPSLGYLHVHASGGLELRLAPRARARLPRSRHVDRREPDVVVARDPDRLVDVESDGAVDPASCAAPEPDGDTLIEVVATCTPLSEALGEDASDGCSVGGAVEVAPIESSSPSACSSR